MGETRLSKVMAERGMCSRREADELIRNGLVQVNGEIASQLGIRVKSNAIITIHPKAVLAREALTTVLLNKPPGYVSGQPEKSYIDAKELVRAKNYHGTLNNIDRCVPHKKKLHIAGRLDIDSSGLLVLTQNGAIARRLIHPDHPTDKEYIVRVSGTITTTVIDILSDGLSLDGKRLRKVEVSQVSKDQLRMILREGRNRQIRRMCEQAGLKVVGLVRTRIGNVHLGNLPRGKWRFMLNNENF
ncbi:MAG: pseudouridylate synthase [Acidiferrobacteraceae bacterium]|nr:pseudouridylate synthase [Acidiferrobacteraceae bacterium]